MLVYCIYYFSCPDELFGARILNAWPAKKGKCLLVFVQFHVLTLIDYREVVFPFKLYLHFFIAWGNWYKSCFSSTPSRILCKSDIVTMKTSVLTFGDKLDFVLVLGVGL